MALIGLVSVDALGQPQDTAPVPTFVGGSSVCPETSAVAREAIRLTPPSQRSIYASGVRVDMDDLGDRYQVRIFAPGLLAQKTYLDPARDCARRITFAAVLVFMTLMPPQLAQQSTESEPEQGDAEEQPAKAEPKPAPVEPPPPSTGQRLHVAAPQRPARIETQAISAREPWVRLALGFAGTWAPPVMDALSTSSFGFGLKSSFGRGALAPFLAFSIATTSKFELTGIGGALRRWPIAAGFEWRPTTSAVDLRATLGAVAVLEQIRGEQLVVAQSQSTVEIGARTGASVAFGKRVIAPFLALYLDFFPAPRKVWALPRGELGTTPAIEIWAHAGAQFGL